MNCPAPPKIELSLDRKVLSIESEQIHLGSYLDSFSVSMQKRVLRLGYLAPNNGEQKELKRQIEDDLIAIGQKYFKIYPKRAELTLITRLFNAGTGRGYGFIDLMIDAGIAAYAAIQQPRKNSSPKKPGA